MERCGAGNRASVAEATAYPSSGTHHRRNDPVRMATRCEPFSLRVEMRQFFWCVRPTELCRRVVALEEPSMSVRVEKAKSVWTVIYSRPEARNAMDPDSADALVAAFESFDADPAASVAVFWGEGGAFCAGWDLNYVASLSGEATLAPLDFPKDGGKPPHGPLGPSRLELSKPVIAAIEGPAVAGGMELGLWGDIR